MIYRFMDTAGDGSGTDNLIGNYSATASAVTVAYIASAGGGGADLHRLIISVVTPRECRQTNTVTLVHCWWVIRSKCLDRGFQLDTRP